MTDHALDSILHANEPIPPPQVRKIIDESNNRLIAEFLGYWKEIGKYIENDDTKAWDYWDYIDNDLKKRRSGATDK
jgi:hypothetical protein